MTYTTRPIDQWIGPETPTHRRTRSKFKTAVTSILSLLERELAFLGAKNVVLEVDVRPWDLRQDGGLRANARPQGPRVIVSFDSKHGPMRWPCDTFDRYEDNLYAIALTLEKLRAIDRYGVSGKGQQYTGFTAIPASTSMSTKTDAAWAVLEREAGWPDGLPLGRDERNRRTMEEMFRDAVKRAHPDVGGTDDRMAAVNRARETILVSLGERA